MSVDFEPNIDSSKDAIMLDKLLWFPWETDDWQKMNVSLNADDRALAMFAKEKNMFKQFWFRYGISIKILRQKVIDEGKISIKNMNNMSYTEL